MFNTKLFIEPCTIILQVIDTKKHVQILVFLVAVALLAYACQKAGIIDVDLPKLPVEED